MVRSKPPLKYKYLNELQQIKQKNIIFGLKEQICKGSFLNSYIITRSQYIKKGKICFLLFKK